MEEYDRIEIQHICSNICSGGTPKSTVEEYYGGTIPWLNTKEINFNRIYKTEKTITDEGLNNSSAQWIPAKSVIVAMYGATAGKTAITQIPLTTNQACCNLTIDSTKADYRFVFYALCNDYAYLASLANGGAQQNLNAQQIREFEIPYPSIEEQECIADILSSLDDKIELNRWINDNLEQQAQALFKSWFVDFEPFKKGKFIDSELGMIPEGWQVEELGNITNSITEKVGKRTDIKVLSPVNTGDLLLSEEYFTKQVYSKNLAKYIMVAPNDFAYNPARINIGSIGMNTFDFSGCVSPVYVVFRCEKEYHHFFNIFKATKNFKEEVNTRAIGGVRQTLSYKDFSLIKIVYPPKEVVNQFNKIYSHIMTLIKKNVLENKRLHQTRETLLPKLMSGELKIKDINN
jgi:type I restriction-modification system specificity protein